MTGTAKRRGDIAALLRWVGEIQGVEFTAVQKRIPDVCKVKKPHSFNEMRRFITWVGVNYGRMGRNIHPAQYTMAEDYEGAVSTTTVSRWLKCADALGWLRLVEPGDRSGKSAVYEIATFWETALDPWPGRDAWAVQPCEQPPY